MPRGQPKQDQPRKIVIPYAPRPLQADFHASAKRWNVAVCHRRYGKTVMAINEMLKRMIECPHKNPQGAYIANTYSQAKRVAWKYLKEYTEPLLERKVNEAELRVEFQTATGMASIYCLGAENYNALRGMYLDFAVLDEYADMPPPLLTEVIRPALADRRGGYLIIGTPRGHNLFWEKYEEVRKAQEQGLEGYHAVIHRASETGILPAEELDALQRSMSPEEYEQELECSFDAAIRGAYYSKAIEALREKGRLRELTHDPSLPVHTGWDLGMSDSTAIWFFQNVGGDIKVFDYYEASGEPLAHYTALLSRKEYTYGRHYFPHDVMVQDLSSGKSRYELLCKLGVRPTVVAKLKVKDGIEAVRMLLPKCWFDDGPSVTKGLEALQQYRAQWDDRGQRWRSQPVHDWTSHAADAFRSLAVGLRDGAGETDLGAIAKRNRYQGGQAVITDYNEFA